MVESDVLLAYILTQTRQNVELLVTHKQISDADGREILSKLPLNAENHSKSEDASVVALTRRTQQLSMSPAPPKVEARAIWDWTSEDPNDLTFEAGEIIEIITETNVDWWTGRNRSGKQGVFPSNYVEKLPTRNVSPILVPEPRNSMTVPPGRFKESEQRYPSPALHHPSPLAPPQPYPGYGPAAPQNYYQPSAGYYPPPAGPPPGAVNYSYTPPAGPSTPQPVPQQVPGKKNKFGGLGQIMAQSAAGGAGFGAGAAIGSGIVNSLF